MADSLLDSDPMILGSYQGRRLVDATMRLEMSLSCDVVLLIGIGDDFFVFQHQFLRNAVVRRDKFIMSGSAS